MELKEYDKLCETILKFYRQPITDENIGILTRYILFANERFNGKGSIYGFRKSYILYAIKEIRKLARERKKLILIPNYEKLELKYHDQDNLFWENFQKCLTNLEFNAIVYRFRDSMTIQEISDKLNQPKHRVLKLLQNGVQKIKTTFQYE